MFNLSKADIHPALMGESGMDIKLSGAARVAIPYAVECKNVEKINVWQAIAQAEANGAKEQLTPVVFFFRNRMEQPYVAVPWDQFMKLIYLDYATTGEPKAGVEPFRTYMKREEFVDLATAAEANAPGLLVTSTPPEKK